MMFKLGYPNVEGPCDGSTTTTVVYLAVLAKPLATHCMMHVKEVKDVEMGQ